MPASPEVPVAVEPISASEPDWSREAKGTFEWNPPRSLLASIRSYQRHRSRGPLATLARKWAVVRYRFWSVVTGADIPLGTRIGGGLVIPHPNGIVIHTDCVIGPNCIIFQQVTLGEGHDGVPALGGDVQLGAGAKLLGNLHVGDHAVVAAMAVVTHDVPAGATAVGIPARILKSPPASS
jgi:serine O-acetyltransferase